MKKRRRNIQGKLSRKSSWNLFDALNDEGIHDKHILITICKENHDQHTKQRHGNSHSAG